MRIAVLSDIHSNLVALDAVLAHAGSIGAVWHLGDVVGYGPDPDGVVERLAGLEAVGVMGNHDAAALGGPEIEWFNPDAKAAAAWTRDRIGHDTRAWLTALPKTAVIDEVSLVHGSPRDPLREYITTPDVAAPNLQALTTSVGLHGHTHVPAVFAARSGSVVVEWPTDGDLLELDDQPTLLNPGSVGQARDGDPRAAYMILDQAAGHATWHRVAYDIAAVQAAMRAVGLPARLADRLAVGR